MNKLMFLLPVFILVSCMSSYPLTDKCELVDYSGLEQYNVNKGDYFCFSQAILNNAKSKHYSTDDFNDFVNYALENRKNRITHNKSGIFPLIGTHEEINRRYIYYADEQGNRIPDETTIHIFDTETFREFAEKKYTKDLKNSLQKEENDEVNRLETKYNLKFCRSYNEINCLIRIPLGRYTFLQHIDKGTLITTSRYAIDGAIVGPNYYRGADIYLVVGNTEKYLREGSFVSEGEFKVLGEYYYKSIRGVEKKAIKIQRLK